MLRVWNIYPHDWAILEGNVGNCFIQRLNIIFFLGIQGTTMGINGITSSRNRFPSHGGFPIGKKTKNIFSKSKFYDLKEVMSEKW